MTITYFTTDTVQAGIIGNLSGTAGDSLYVAEGVLLGVTGQFANTLAGGGAGQSFTIAGSVHSVSAPAVQASGDGAVVNVLASGSVTNSSTSNGAALGIGIGSHRTSHLFNDGHIAGGAGVYTAQNSEIINTGTIAGIGSDINSAGILIASGTTDTVDIVNAGTIAGHSAAIIYYSHGLATVSLDNSGQVIGDIILSRASDATIVNTGLIDGAITLGGGADSYSGRHGGAVVDTVYGGAGTDELTGSAADDMFDGGDNKDMLRGHRGDDTLAGGAGNDDIRGGRGDDTIEGGTGKDMLRGGLDHDTFVFSSASDSGIGAAADQIFGFSLKEDLIDLSGLGGSETVSFASKSFGTLVKVDADGDGHTDFQIKVMGVDHLTQDHFIL